MPCLALVNAIEDAPAVADGLRDTAALLGEHQIALATRLLIAERVIRDLHAIVGVTGYLYDALTDLLADSALNEDAQEPSTQRAIGFATFALKKFESLPSAGRAAITLTVSP